MTGPRIVWLAADSAGLAHAQLVRALRTVCGTERAIDQRHAWPTRSRCPACLAAIEKASNAAQAVK